MTMGDRIKDLRERIGLTQEELGEKIGVQKSAIRKYEKGEVENIKRSAIGVMADLFGVTPDYILFGVKNDDAPALYTTEEQELIELYRGLDAAGQAALIGAARGLSVYFDNKRRASL